MTATTKTVSVCAYCGQPVEPATYTGEAPKVYHYQCAYDALRETREKYQQAMQRLKELRAS